MNHKSRPDAPATHIVTIQTPFGVLKYSYTLSGTPCADCGNPLVTWKQVEASPRLRSGEADYFLVSLPDFLAVVGEAAFIET
jgi:hypothetical protein